MKVGFICNKCLPFDSTTVGSAPLGGTESAVYYLSKALSEAKVDVTVFTEHKSPASSVTRYEHLAKFNPSEKFDALISVRDWMPLMMYGSGSLRLLWTGDAADQPSTFGLGDKRVINRLTGVLAVSAWQASTLAGFSGFPIEKVFRLPNGIPAENFSVSVPKKRKRMIYSSTPYRGLDLAPAIFEKVLSLHPDAELHVYSGFEVYGGSGPVEVTKRFEETKARLLTLKGVKVFGNVSQKELAKAYMESAVLFYPNTFAETSCITALEAQAAGCVVVSSKLGALPETVGDDGVLISGQPGSPEYLSQFASAVDRTLKDDTFFRMLSDRARNKVLKDSSWKSVAAGFHALLQGLLTKSGSTAASHAK